MSAAVWDCRFLQVSRRGTGPNLIRFAAMSESIVVHSPAVRCQVFTFKEGLLSGMAHDLKLVVERCSIEWTAAPPLGAGESPGGGVAQVRASFDPRSLRVVCAQRDGRDQPGSLSAAQCAEIERNIQHEVLRTDRFAEVRFVSTQVKQRTNGLEIVGELTLCGQRRTLTAQVVKQAERWACEVRIHQPDFGIKPYSAALGTLRVKPELLVTVSMPLTESPSLT